VKSPYCPELNSDDDCRRFDKFDEEEPFYPPDDKKQNRRQRKDINFVGYTYKKDVEEQKNNLVKALNESLQPDVSGGSSSNGSTEGTP
jgi:serine/threonine kinase 38